MYAHVALIPLACAVLAGNAFGTQVPEPTDAERSTIPDRLERVEAQADSLRRELDRLRSQTYGLGDLERRVQELEDEVGGLLSAGWIAFLFGIFCALWAQNTQRNGWLWFFFGAILPPFAGVALLIKNAEEVESSPLMRSTSLLAEPLSPKPKDHPIRLYRGTLPDCPYEEIGTVSVRLRDKLGSMQAHDEALRTRARRMGGDAVIGLAEVDEVQGALVSGVSVPIEHGPLLSGTVIRFTDPDCMH